MTPEVLARMLEYQADFCALTTTDFQNPNFKNWDDNYRCYVQGGASATFNGQHPTHKPPA